MQLVVTGLNHETAPLSVRERVAISREQLPRALAALRAVPGVNEAAILSTCNRTELYVACDPDFHTGSLGHFLRAFHDLPPGAVGEDRMYAHEGLAAVRHICGVTAGLNSAVLGETQILAQVKEAYHVAADEGTLGPHLHQLFNLAIATAKQVQTDTALGLNSLSLGSVATKIIRAQFPAVDRLRVLVLGTGPMGRLLLRHLAGEGVTGITLASRDPLRAKEAAAGTEAQCVRLDWVCGRLRQFHVVVAATTGFVLTPADVEEEPEQRETPLLVIDLGVPRNVEPAVGKLPYVQLLNVDDLKQVADANLDSRRQSVQEAWAIVDRGARRYAEWLATRAIVPLIGALSADAERIRAQELNRTIAHTGFSNDQRQALEELTRTLASRLLHECTITLKRFAVARQSHW